MINAKMGGLKVIEIRPGKKYYAPELEGKRDLSCASNTRHGAAFNLAYIKCIGWGALINLGWTVEEFWVSEYE